MDSSLYHDKLAIADLLCRYALAVDTDQFDQMTEIFTEDAQFSLVGMEPAEWRWSIAEYCQFVSTIVRQCDWVMHNTTNIIADVDGDTAFAISYLNTAYGVRAGEHIAQFGVHSDQPVDVEIGARYRDQLVRTASGWRIRERVCEALYQRERAVIRLNTA
jgi:hypothetical protein